MNPGPPFGGWNPGWVVWYKYNLYYDLIQFVFLDINLAFSLAAARSIGFPLPPTAALPVPEEKRECVDPWTVKHRSNL